VVFVLENLPIRKLGWVRDAVGGAKDGQDTSHVEKKFTAIAPLGDGRGNYAIHKARRTFSFAAHDVTIWTRSGVSAIWRVEDRKPVRPVCRVVGVEGRKPGAYSPAEGLNRNFLNGIGLAFASPKTKPRHPTSE
jgi:hypothetical protein